MTRRERLLKLAEWYGIDPKDHSTTTGEDLAEILDNDESGEKPIEKWACVTSAGEYTYIYVLADLDAAQQRAVQDIGDDIYAESPVEIVDLDTGAKHVPKWDSLQWTIFEPTSCGRPDCEHV